LVAAAALVACSTKYSSSDNGLIVVPSNSSAVMQSFSLDLSNGAVSQINNVNGPPTDGIPGQVILDPAGANAYVIVSANPAVLGSVTGIQVFPILSDGKLGTGSTPTATPNPVAMAIDSAGKFLFVANSAGSAASGTITVFSIGSAGSLTEVGSASLPIVTGGGVPSPSALAVTRTVYPQLYSFCSNGQTPPTTEYLYVTDFVNDVLLNYLVSSSGGLTLMATATGNGVVTGTGPNGVAIDPCNRFAFVANATSNNVSAYTICNNNSTTSQGCQAQDFSLHPVGTPIAAGDTPGPIAVDAYGNFLYVVDTGSDQISAYRFGTATGALTAESISSTNIGPNSIAVRSDDTWVFVANATSGNLSQYAITLSTGALTPATGPVVTFNTPTGVAVK